MKKFVITVAAIASVLGMAAAATQSMAKPPVNPNCSVDPNSCGGIG